MVNRIREGIKILPHEKQALIINENAGFGHLLTFNTPESVYEQQPVFLPEPRILFVAAGRLDNREELCSKLDIGLDNRLTDGRLMQAAYLRWGKESPDHLKGDWSYAAYDLDQRELFLARDHHGYTALYYYHDKDCFVFSSSPKGIFALRQFGKKINTRAFLANLLLWKPEEKNLQAYEGLQIVPPGHTLTLKEEKTALNRYWFPEKVPLRIYKNTSDYAEELREIFKEAVRVRMRSYRPVATLLSGGLDSGSVTAMAALLLKQQGETLVTFSHVPLYQKELSQEPPSRRLPDETPQILATASHSENISPLLFNSSHISPVDGFLRIVSMTDSYSHAAWNAFWVSDLSVQARNRGFGTLLTGEMGNGTISYPGISYLLPGNGSTLLKHPGKLLKPVLKRWILKHFPGILDQKLNDFISSVKNSYVKPQVLEEWNIIGDIKKNPSRYAPYYSNAREGMLDLLRVGSNPRCQAGSLRSQAVGIDLRDPTGDRNVIEYCLSIPNSAFFDHKLNNRQIIQKMMKGYLPDPVLFSTRKGLQGADIHYRLRDTGKQVNDLIELLSFYPPVNELMDMKKLQNDWKVIQNSERMNVSNVTFFFKALMFAYFIYISNEKTVSSF